MSVRTIKIIAFIILLVHGIGHLQGVVAASGLKINNKEPALSWLMKNYGRRQNAITCFVLFFITALFGITAAIGVMGIIIPFSYWGIFAAITAILSTICLIVFPNGFAQFFNVAGAIVVNLIIFYSVVLEQHWPSALFDA